MERKTAYVSEIIMLRSRTAYNVVLQWYRCRWWRGHLPKRPHIPRHTYRDWFFHDPCRRFVKAIADRPRRYVDMSSISPSRRAQLKILIRNGSQDELTSETQSRCFSNNLGICEKRWNCRQSGSISWTSSMRSKAMASRVLVRLWYCSETFLVYQKSLACW